VQRKKQGEVKGARPLPCSSNIRRVVWSGGGGWGGLNQQQKGLQMSAGLNLQLLALQAVLGSLPMATPMLSRREAERAVASRHGQQALFFIWIARVMRVL
jgi:hypothetical protein